MSDDVQLLNRVYPILYKISGTGKVLEWYVSVQPEDPPVHAADFHPDTCYKITITHGQQDGKKQTDTELVTEGKNVGQANETTPLQQAHLQAEARWKKQIDRHYRETIEEAKKAAKAASNPMLAHKYTEKAHTLKPGTTIAIQAKLDGMRCLATNEDGEITLQSRGGKAITAMPHIVEALQGWLEPGETVDGELYSPDLDFETLMSICRKKEPDPRHREVQYHVFDVVSPLPYVERTETLNPKEPFIKVVPFFVFDVTDDMDSLLHEQLAAAEIGGFEGIIIRRLDLPYEHKRSVQLLKLKRFADEEFEIVGSETGTTGSDKDGLLVCFVCRTAEGKEFKAPLCGSESLLKEMWERRESYVGELATVMFQEKTKYGVPRFPKVKGIRGREDLSS